MMSASLKKQKIPTCVAFSPGFVNIHVEATASSAAPVEKPHVRPSLIVEMVQHAGGDVEQLRVRRFGREQQ